MKPRWMIFAVLAATGCATSGPSIPIQPEPIEIGSRVRQGCNVVGAFSLLCKDRSAFAHAVENHAFRMGANFMQVTSLSVGEVTGRLKVEGVAMRCSMVDPHRAEMMPEHGQLNMVDTTQDMAADEGGAHTRKARTRQVHTRQVNAKREDWPASHYLMTMPRVPEAEDDNPFE